MGEKVGEEADGVSGCAAGYSGAILEGEGGGEEEGYVTGEVVG